MNIINEGGSLLDLQKNRQYLELFDELLTGKLLGNGSLSTKVTTRVGHVGMKDILHYIYRTTELS